MGKEDTKTTPAALHHGKVDWLPWGEQAFELARQQDRLVLVDVGAVWCHWCHVMDRTTYDHDQVARLVADKFVPVRVDRDQRPDIDSRLQRSAPMIQSQGNGWPLTIVLTPDGHVLYKATYVPPTADNRFGTGFGMVDLLEKLDEIWRKRRDEFDQAGSAIAEQLNQRNLAVANQPGAVGPAPVEAILDGIRTQFDTQFGGFGGGGGPKFPHCSAIDLALIRAHRDGDGTLRRIALETLDAMARGGIHDHLGGGFHRYSVDPYWRVPHFEKMAYDNAPLLGNYARAFALTGDDRYAEVARGIVRFTRDVLCDGEGGGFYGSQDADIGLHDDGDYFTWSLDEVKSVLDGDELAAVVARFNIDQRGDMHEAPGRNVLNVGKSLDELARVLNVDAAALADHIASGKARLLAARGERPTPWIDRTLFADWNGMYLRALADAYKLVEPDAGWLELAERAADRLLGEALDADGRLAHYILPDGPVAHGATECKVFGQLADHAHLAWGLLGLYTAGGRVKYLEAAGRLLEHVVEHLQDDEHGGFFDAAMPADAAPILQQPQKNWEDSPSQSASSVACCALIEASELTGRDDFRAAAERALAGFAGAIESRLGLFVAGWALAADMLLQPPPHVVVIGAGDGADALTRASWAATLGAAVTEPLDPSRKDAAGRLKALNYLPPHESDAPLAYVCHAGTCREPADSPDILRAQLQSAKA